MSAMGVQEAQSDLNRYRNRKKRFEIELAEKQHQLQDINTSISFVQKNRPNMKLAAVSIQRLTGEKQQTEERIAQLHGLINDMKEEINHLEGFVHQMGAEFANNPYLIRLH